MRSPHSFICNRLRDSNLSKKDLNPNSFLINFVDFSVVIFCGNSKHLGWFGALFSPSFLWLGLFEDSCYCVFYFIVVRNCSFGPPSTTQDCVAPHVQACPICMNFRQPCPGFVLTLNIRSSFKILSLHVQANGSCISVHKFINLVIYQANGWCMQIHMYSICFHGLVCFLRRVIQPHTPNLKILHPPLQVSSWTVSEFRQRWSFVLQF